MSDIRKGMKYKGTHKINHTYHSIQFSNDDDAVYKKNAFNLLYIIPQHPYIYRIHPQNGVALYSVMNELHLNAWR